MLVLDSSLVRRVRRSGSTPVLLFAEPGELLSPDRFLFRPVPPSLSLSLSYVVFVEYGSVSQSPTRGFFPWRRCWRHQLLDVTRRAPR